MNKKILIIISFIIFVLGFIATGLIGETATNTNKVLPTFLNFKVDGDIIYMKQDGKKYLVFPENLVEGEDPLIYKLDDLINYDENATKDITEIDIIVNCNYEDLFVYRSLSFQLMFDPSDQDIPLDLVATVVIKTNDGSNLSDTLYVVYDPSGQQHHVDPIE